MAGRILHELDFALNARLNSGFSGTFSKAQSQFVQLGNEIQKLSKMQSDISAYQKQQSAIAATETKLENLKKQHGLLQKEIDGTTGSTAGLEREKLKLEQRINEAGAALERQKYKLEATGAALADAKIDTANLEQADARLTAQIAEMKAQQDAAAQSALTFGEKASQSFGAIQSAITAAGVGAALVGIGGAYIWTRFSWIMGTAAFIKPIWSVMVPYKRTLVQRKCLEVLEMSCHSRTAARIRFAAL